MSAPSCAMSILKPPWLLPCVLCELGSLHAKSTLQPAGHITPAAMHFSEKAACLSLLTSGDGSCNTLPGDAVALV